MGGLQLFGHLQGGLVDSQAGFHAHHHQVQGVGQAAGDGVLAAAYAEQQELHGRRIAQGGACRCGEDHVLAGELRLPGSEQRADAE